MNEAEFEVLEAFQRIVQFSNGSKFIISYKKGDIIRTSIPEHEIYKKLVSNGKIKLVSEYNE